MMASTVDVIAPKWIIVPQADQVSGCHYTGNAYATSGALLMSGAKLFVFNGAAWEIVGAQ